MPKTNVRFIGVFFYYKESPFYALFISRFMPKINGRFEPA